MGRRNKNYSTEELIDAELELFGDRDQKNDAGSSAEMETTGPETKNGIVANAETVNVRKEPSMKSNNVIEILRRGSLVRIFDKVGDFYRVLTSTNQEGYIHFAFVEERLKEE